MKKKQKKISNHSWFKATSFISSLRNNHTIFWGQKDRMLKVGFLRESRNLFTCSLVCVCVA